MTNPLKICTAFLLVLFVLAPEARAQQADLDAAQVVGLFAQSCFAFTGNPSGLRDWAEAHGLPQVGDLQAEAFLGSIGPGVVFGASTVSGKHVLTSYDDGSCQVIALAGNAADIESDLLNLFRSINVTIQPGQLRTSSDGQTTQQMYHASLSNRMWVISVTTHVHEDVSGLAPEVHLLATSG